MTGIIGYDNHAEDATTVTASNEATGFDKENAYDWLQATSWKPGAAGSQTLQFDFGASVAVDYFAIAAHNLGSEGASIQFQWDNASVWTDLIGTITPSNDAVIMRTFTSQSDTSFRILITNCTVDTYISVVAFGQRLDLPQAIEPGGWAPAPYARQIKVNTNKSEKGLFLGRAVDHEGISGRVMQSYLTRAWVASNWLNLVQHIETKPFFYSWDNDNYQDQAGLFWLPDAEKSPDIEFMQDSPLYMKFDFKVEGIYQ